MNTFLTVLFVAATVAVLVVFIRRKRAKEVEAQIALRSTENGDRRR